MKRTIVFAALAFILAAIPMHAQSYDWSMPGSCGRIHPSTPTGYSFNGPTFSFVPLFRGHLTARYPVTNTYGSFASFSPAWTTLWAAYTDNSSSGSVSAKLIKVDKCTGTETTLCTAISVDANGPTCTSCTFNSSDIDFQNNSYYVEVTLTRTASTATESLHSVGIN